MKKTFKKRAIDKDMQKRYPRTITPELYEAWQVMRRLGDAAKICKALKKCRPVVDHALNYGHVKNMKLADRISGFFESRLKDEKKEALNLMRLAEENN